MRSPFVLCLLALMFPLPVFAQGPVSLDLIAPLQSSPAGYSQPYRIFGGSPSLALDPTKANPVVLQALGTLEQKEQGLPLDDAAVVVLSVLKAADSDPNGYLEELLGVSDKNVQELVAEKLPKSIVHDSYVKYRENREKVKEATRLSGVARLALQIILPGQDVFSVLTGEIGSSILEGASQLLSALNAENKSLLKKEMSVAMVEILGEKDAKPSAEISWIEFNYFPVEELISRLKRRGWAKKAIQIHSGKEPGTLNETQQVILKTAQSLYAQDVLLSEILLSVLSRQVAGISPKRVSVTNATEGNRGAELLAGLVQLLNPEELAGLAAAVDGLSRNRDEFLGLPAYARDGERLRRKEIAFTTLWLKALIHAKSAVGPEATPEQLEDTVAGFLRGDAYLNIFLEERANASLSRLMSPPAEAKGGGILRKFGTN
ncbi:MAG: hypothetical protein AB7G93_20970 [Bdellovibrionales bacterium]